MNKLYAVFAALVAASVLTASGEIAQQALSGTVVTTNAVTGTLPIRGEIRNIYFNIPTGKTGTLNIVSSEGFVVLGVTNVSADTLYAPRIATHTIAGAAITEAGGGATNDTYNVIYAPQAVVGDCTATISPAAATTGTNAWSVSVNYAK